MTAFICSPNYGLKGSTAKTAYNDTERGMLSTEVELMITENTMVQKQLNCQR